MNLARSLQALLLGAFISTLTTGTTVHGAEDGKSGVSVGQVAPSFQFTTADRKVVTFPDYYKGKIVLLDFWATWCGPCRIEMPNVIAAYQKYQTNGFEVLGISLDRTQDAPKLRAYLKANKITWPQVFDGKFWEATVAVKYGIKSIPRAVLVDGTTGVILAEGPGARGSKLAPAIEKALAEKTRSAGN